MIRDISERVNQERRNFLKLAASGSFTAALVAGAGGVLWSTEAVAQTAREEREREQAAEHTMTLATAYVLGASRSYPIMQLDLKENIQNATGGKVYVKLAPGGQLGAGGALVQAVQGGTIQCAQHSLANFAPFASAADAVALFAREFPDAFAQMPGLASDFAAHPTSPLATLYLQRWHLDNRAVLLGDAAHAMVPFHGQGMNCAFEDCVALAEHLQRDNDIASAFASFGAERQPNALAIQTMALENYQEMRDQVRDPSFLLQRQLETLLAQRNPCLFIPRYTMVTFQRVPYASALERGRIQRQIMIEASAGHSAIEQIDLDAADAMVRARLVPL